MQVTILNICDSFSSVKIQHRKSEIELSDIPGGRALDFGKIHVAMRLLLSMILRSSVVIVVSQIRRP